MTKKEQEEYGCEGFMKLVVFPKGDDKTTRAESDLEYKGNPEKMARALAFYMKWNRDTLGEMILRAVDIYNKNKEI